MLVVVEITAIVLYVALFPLCPNRATHPFVVDPRIVVLICMVGLFALTDITVSVIATLAALFAGPLGLTDRITQSSWIQARIDFKRADNVIRLPGPGSTKD